MIIRAPTAAKNRPAQGSTAFRFDRSRSSARPPAFHPSASPSAWHETARYCEHRARELRCVVLDCLFLLAVCECASVRYARELAATGPAWRRAHDDSVSRFDARPCFLVSLLYPSFSIFKPRRGYRPFVPRARRAGGPGRESAAAAYSDKSVRRGFLISKILLASQGRDELVEERLRFVFGVEQSTPNRFPLF